MLQDHKRERNNEIRTPSPTNYFEYRYGVVHRHHDISIHLYGGDSAKREGCKPRSIRSLQTNSQELFGRFTGK